MPRDIEYVPSADIDVCLLTLVSMQTTELCTVVSSGRRPVEIERQHFHACQRNIRLHHVLSTYNRQLEECVSR